METIREILKSSSHIDQRNNDGMTVLEYAAPQGMEEIVKLLTDQ